MLDEKRMTTGGTMECVHKIARREDFSRCAADERVAGREQMDRGEVVGHEMEVMYGREDGDAFAAQGVQ